MNRRVLCLGLAVAAVALLVGTSTADAGLFGRLDTCAPATCEPATCAPATCEPVTCAPATCEPVTCCAPTCRPKLPVLRRTPIF